MRDRHGSPFEHTSFTFFVRAPIFMWREHMRHRVASYNEESGRYRELEPVFYVPGPERHLVQQGKPGAYEFVARHRRSSTRWSTPRCAGAASRPTPPTRRCSTPASPARSPGSSCPSTIYSSAYVTMNARALMNFLSLRTKREGSHFPSFPQREIEMVAELYEEEFERLMPLTHAAFQTNGRVAP